jgi:hypothetical protein
MSRWSRRTFLQTLGASPALVPLLDAGRASAAPFPKRVVIAIWTNGCVAKDFFPSAAGTLKEQTLPASTAALTPHKEDVAIVQGIRMSNFLDYGDHGAGHENYASTFLGTKPLEIAGPAGPRFIGGSPSLDQYIADGLEKQGVKTSLRSLNVGVVVGGGFEGNHQSRCFWRGPNQQVSPELDPTRAAAAVFSGKPGMPVDPAVLERLRLERKSMLDYLGPSVERFGKRVGSAGKSKIDAHLASIRDLEKQLAVAAGPAAPQKCDAPNLGVFDPKKAADYPAILSAHMDVIVNAFKCDMTRVATIQLGNGNGAGLEFSWIGLQGPGMEYGRRDWHDVAHRNGAGDKTKLDAWLMGQMAELIKRMKAIPEGNGTMFDNAVILWANHMGNGGAHNSTDIPWVLGGRCGGYLKMGQSLRPGAIPTNRVMQSILAAMGVPGSGFGDPRYGGELSELRA